MTLSDRAGSPRPSQGAVLAVPIGPPDRRDTQSGRVRCIAFGIGHRLRVDHGAEVVERTVERFGELDAVVNNVAYQEPQDCLLDIDEQQWARTFDVNVHSFYRVTRAALRHLEPGAASINTASINGLRGNRNLIDYSATKGAGIALTYSLAQSLNAGESGSTVWLLARCGRR